LVKCQHLKHSSLQYKKKPWLPTCRHCQT